MAEHFSIGTAGTRVSLINTSGFDVKKGWRPQAGGYDDVFQESSLADYRQLATYRDITVVETIPLGLRATSQDNAATQTQGLRQILRTARDYWATTWQDDPVYLQLQGSAETNARYAIVHTGRMAEDQSIFSQFMKAANPTRAVMRDLNLMVERGPWLENAPGTGTAVHIGAMEAYDGRNLGNTDAADGFDPTTSEGAVYIANKRNEANLSDVYFWDEGGGAWNGANLMDDADRSFSFLPAAPEVDDFVIFGIDTSLDDSGPFCSLVFDLETVLNPGTGITIQWRYRDSNNGDTVDPGDWTALGVQDNTNADGAETGDAFDTAGIRSVHWEQPQYWQTADPDPTGGDALGVTGYWVAAYVTASNDDGDPPAQQNRLIYTVTWPYVEIEDDQVDGDLPALARVLMRQQSDPLAVASAATTARVIVGLRSLDRGSDFTAYFNASDEQNPSHISPAAVGVGAFATDVETPTGRKLTCTNPAAGAAVMTLKMTTAGSIQYQGRFHAFIRAHQTSGAAGTIELALSVVMGAAYSLASVTTPYIAMQGTTAWEVLDMGSVMLPPSDTMLRADDFALYFEILAAGDGAADCDIFDLVLIPADEWALDTISPIDPSGTQIGLGQRLSAIYSSYLDIDSIVKPNSFIRSILRFASDDAAAGPWETITNGPCMFRDNTTAGQRLWFLQLSDTSLPYLGRLEKACSVQAYKNQRYESMRGAV